MIVCYSDCPSKNKSTTTQCLHTDVSYGTKKHSFNDSVIAVLESWCAKWVPLHVEEKGNKANLLCEKDTVTGPSLFLNKIGECKWVSIGIL